MSADQLVTLGLEYDVIDIRVDEALAAGDADKADALSTLVAVAIEDQAMAMVPTTAAGAYALLRITRGFLTEFQPNEITNQIVNNLAAGLGAIADREARQP